MRTYSACTERIPQIEYILTEFFIDIMNLEHPLLIYSCTYTCKQFFLLIFQLVFRLKIWIQFLSIQGRFAIFLGPIRRGATAQTQGLNEKLALDEPQTTSGNLCLKQLNKTELIYRQQIVVLNQKGKRWSRNLYLLEELLQIQQTPQQESKVESKSNYKMKLECFLPEKIQSRILKINF